MTIMGNWSQIISSEREDEEDVPLSVLAMNFNAKGKPPPEKYRKMEKNVVNG